MPHQFMLKAWSTRITVLLLEKLGGAYYLYLLTRFITTEVILLIAIEDLFDFLLENVLGDYLFKFKSGSVNIGR